MHNMKSCLFIKSILLNISMCTSIDLNYTNKLNLLSDVVKSYEIPTAVTAFVCWDTETKVKFAAQLQNSERPTTIVFSNDIKSTIRFSIETINLVDLNCPNSKELLLKAQKERLFRSHYRWLILDKYQNGVIPPLELQDFNIFADSDVIIAKNIGDGIFHIFLIYKMDFNNQWLKEPFGTWTTTQGLKISPEMLVSKQMRRKNLMKRRVVSSVVLSNNKSKLDLSDIKSLDDVETTLSYRLSAPAYEFLNATRVYVVTDTYGYIVNGSYNGMVGMIQRGEAEVGGTVLFITKNRIDTLFYMITAVNVKIRFLFRQPPLSLENNLYLLPFNGTVWLCLGGIMVVLIFVLYVNSLWDARRSKTIPNSVGDITMIIVCALSQQGSASVMRGISSRMVMLILFVAFLFLHTSYSASVVALLQSTSGQIRTLEDLLNSKLSLGVHDTPYNRHYFMHATEPIRKAIYEKKIAPRGSKPRFIQDAKEGVRLMQKTPFAFNINLGVNYRMVQELFQEHEKCNLKEISYIPQQVPWLTTHKQWPYREMLQIALFRLREHGLIYREERLVLTPKPKCAGHGGSFTSVSFMDMRPGLLMLLYGMLVSVAMLIAEVLVHRKMAVYKNLIPRRVEE